MRSARGSAWIALAALVAAFLAGAVVLWRVEFFPPRPERSAAIDRREPATFVGAAQCAQCHRDAFRLWSGSHHDFAMRAPGEDSVLGDFSGARFEHFGVESVFFRRDGRYLVRTEGADGASAEFEVKYVFGRTPLQQYLVEFPGGRLQALSIAWDSRPAGSGGGRWFHLHPEEAIRPGDPLHWTGFNHNWNAQCAECHSTNLSKGYDAASDSYRTTFSEPNVACEACHGPGSRHLAWARSDARTRAPADRGLVVDLRSDGRTAWRFADPDARIALRERPPSPAAGNVCAPCHARRSTLAEGVAPGRDLADSHRLAAAVPPNYHADGRQREEVYTWGSFVQSRMFQRGVGCVDCHEPHSVKLRAEGDAVCARCHNPKAFAGPQHHFHDVRAATAPRCVDCHMPATTYMAVDPRRDHSFSTPRPDVGAATGAPDACTSCHGGRDQAWAAAAMDGWYGRGWRDRPEHGRAVHDALRRSGPSPDLERIARDDSRPPMVRASALAVAARAPGSASLAALATELLRHASPELRLAAIDALESYPVAARLAAAPLMDDPVLGVRVEAARLLADAPDATLAPPERASRARALAAYVDTLALNADWPTARVNLGNLRLRQGRTFDAWAAYREAARMDPRLVEAHLGMAEAERIEGRDADAVATLQRALGSAPESGPLQHALGLALVRAGRRTEALAALEAAARGEPQNARYAYVLAVALQGAGRSEQALAVVTRALEGRPDDADLLTASTLLHRDKGDMETARLHVRRLLAAAPDSAAARRLALSLGVAP